MLVHEWCKPEMELYYSNWR